MKKPGSEAGHSPSSLAVKNGGVINPLANIFTALCIINYTGENFTFVFHYYAPMVLVIMRQEVPVFPIINETGHLH